MKHPAKFCKTKRSSKLYYVPASSGREEARLVPGGASTAAPKHPAKLRTLNFQPARKEQSEASNYPIFS